MQVIRKIVERADIKVVSVPEEFGDQVEIIVLPVRGEKAIPSDSENLMKLQERTGFASETLAGESEDVWNEL